MDSTVSLAARAYGAARPATAAAPGEGPDLARMAGDFAAVLQNGEEVAKAAMTGKADQTALVQALSASQSAVETAVTVRDRVVEAYQEILRMPV